MPVGRDTVCEVVELPVDEDAVAAIVACTNALRVSIPIVSGIPSRICLVSSRFSALTMAGFGRMSFGASGTMRPEASMAARAGFTIM
jgi:hypothetical protein